MVIVDNVLDDIDQPFVHKVHHQQLKHGDSNDQNALELISVLGGIDDILTTYLTSENIIINKNKLQQIYQIITTPQQFQMKNKSKQLTIFKGDSHQQNEINDQINGMPNIEFPMDPNANYLFSLFGEQNGIKITYILRSKVFQSLLILSSLIWFTFWISNLDSSLYYYIYIISICCFLWYPWMILNMLCVNKNALKIITKTFEFWLKIYYGVLMSATTQYNFNFHSIMGIIASCFYCLCIVLFIAMVSSLDGLQTNKFVKVIFTGWWAFLCIFISFSYQFKSYTDADNSIIQISDNVQFSLNSMRTMSTRVLGIFLAKQAFLSFFRSSYANTISFKPLLIWNTSNNKDGMEQMSERNTNLNENELEMDEMQIRHVAIDIRMDCDDNLSSNSKNEEIY